MQLGVGGVKHSVELLLVGDLPRIAGIEKAIRVPPGGRLLSPFDTSRVI